jgi:hypothetical protein
VATTSTDVRCRSKISKMRARKPCASSIRGERTLTTVTPSLPAIAVTGRRGASKAMSVPCPARRALRMETGMPTRTAGAIVPDAAPWRQRTPVRWPRQTDPRNEPRIRHHPRICGKHAVDVGPDFDGLGAQRGA